MDVSSPLFGRDGWNAAVGWGVVAVLLGFAGYLAAAGAYLWVGFALSTVALVLVPAALERSPSAAVPGELAVVAVAPLAATALGLGEAVVEAATFLAVLSLGLLATLELRQLTSLRLPTDVAVAFVSLTTMALAGVWVTLQWFSDALLGTAFVHSRVDMMWDLSVATVVAVLGAPLLLLYARGVDEAGDAEHERQEVESA